MRPAPVNAQLAASNLPTPTRAINGPLKKLDVRYPETAANNRRPTASSGRENVARIEGQATPRRPSGMPRAMKAVNERRIKPVLGRDRGDMEIKVRPNR